MEHPRRRHRSTRTLAGRTRDILAHRFPAAFKGRGESKTPLKIGIDRDILAAMPELGDRRIVLALQDYTFGPTYLSNLHAGAPRIGLDGAPAGEVSAEEAAHAEDRMRLFKPRAPAAPSKAEDKGATQ